MSIYIDVGFKSFNKFGEELCGDNVEIVRTEHSVIMVLADGLGSGVKANILSTLTSKIIATMLKEGARVEDAAETVAATLPICKVRHLAYSTFSILEIFDTGDVYLVEFDSPSCVFVRDGKIMDIPFEARTMGGKAVREARFQTVKGDVFAIFSDGVVFAGVGGVMNFGFQWENAAEHIRSSVEKERTASRLAHSLSLVCESLFAGHPGDDTTVLVAKTCAEKPVSLFSGPPKDKEKDEELVHDFMAGRGKRVVCGGSSANILSRILNRPITTSLDYTDPDVPPLAKIDGIDLVTEGVLTLSKTVEILKQFEQNATTYQDFRELDSGGPAQTLAKLLLEDCTSLSLFVGTAINPAHQNPGLPVDLSIKLRIIENLSEVLTKLGKTVSIKYY